MKQRKQYLLSLAVSIFLALLVGAVIMLISGHNPIEGYQAMFTGAFGNQRAIGNTLYKFAQLCITGIATAVASQGGIFNVGGEGQMYLGALASCWLGALLTGQSPWLAIPLCLLIAIAAGAFYAYIPAILKIKMGISEVITTILMNSIAIFFCTYMANGPLKTAEKGVSQGTVSLDKTFQFSKLIRGSNLTESIFYIAVITLRVWYLMSRTTVGFQMKLTGQNERFARFAGLNASTLGILGMLISGAMCGMLGMFECFGLQTRFKPDFSNEFYFDGMLVAMIMQYRPLGTILMSLLFGILKVGGITMQSQTGISSELILIIQSIIIFFMAAQEGILANLAKRRASRAAAAGTSGGVKA